MKTVKIVGVPEHFNFPWLMAIEEGAFKTRGIDLVWTDIPEGTGKMSEMLENGQAEIHLPQSLEFSIQNSKHFSPST